MNQVGKVLHQPRFPWAFHRVGSRITAQSQVFLSSVLSQSSVPLQSPTSRSGMLSETRCIRSSVKQPGTWIIQFESSPLKMLGFEMPVSFQRNLKFVSFSEARRYLRLSRYLLCSMGGMLRTL